MHPCFAESLELMDCALSWHPRTTASEVSAQIPLLASGLASPIGISTILMSWMRMAMNGMRGLLAEMDVIEVLQQ